MVVACNLCDRKFTRKKNLYAHVRNVHNAQISFVKSDICCGACKQRFLNFNELRFHLSNDHNVPIQSESASFSNFKGESLLYFILYINNFEMLKMFIFVLSFITFINFHYRL